MAQFSADDLMFKPGLMTGERILITGGGTGLGKVMAEALLMLGAEVYICGRRGGVVEATAKELMDAHGGKCVGLACDIRVPEAISEMLDTIWADGALTGLVNNAAGNFISRTQDLSPRGFDAIANIVFRGSFFVTLDCGKRWIAEGRRASVISILTTWIWNGGPFTVPSAMSKAGLATMSQSLAVEWGQHGIRFNNIAPGPFPTEGMSARLNPSQEEGAGGAYSDMSGHPMGRVGDMRELANLAVYLLHPLSAYVNGQTIAIDGAAWQASGGNFSRLTGWGESEWAAAKEAIQATNAKDRAARTV
ncbi:short-chain dehydrogenase [Phenylobacterium sp. Root77]|jgi:NAD(P)-dependent dehydrogenase (short-subunit alcohol dehydrogenase family)|uniref:SDR family oxidoreductase n=1 Tax=unclassified Phenylobacterium TaxID=2640670 RepID=UPI0006F56E02|nr:MULTISPECIES: SDR family oxidoreductase [unclassified Phenylobacterium]KQW73357.1 short-chain dehydrogenase [Phenylobacterium sp. Root1277]KQW92576.1 short-chain dehydrogenase [Phenylobacterium sp. Root1290]KRC40805.1 short-chain dehydrogenase [Phenylobacterium sp. Root77]